MTDRTLSPSQTNVISYYPLTDGFKLRNRQRFPDPTEFHQVSQFRNRGAIGLLRSIRKLKTGRIVVAIEDENSRPLAPPLLLLAALSGSRTIDIIWPDDSFETIPKTRIARMMVQLGLAQAHSRLALRRSLKALKGFEAPSPLQVRPGSKILYLDGNLSFGVAAGGSFGHIRGVIDGLIGRGYTVDYASCKTIPTDVAGSRWLDPGKVDLLAFPPEYNYYSYGEQYNRFADAALAAGDYAFMYQRMSVHNYTGALMRRTHKLPLVLEYNGSEAWAAANWHEKLRLHDAAIEAERVSLTQADLVVTVSKVLGDEAARAGVPRERIVVYPNCIDPKIFDPNRFTAQDNAALRARLGIAPDAVLATFIGTFGTWHGVDFLARALRRLIDEDPAWLARHKLHFLLVGDGLRMSEVRDSIGAAPYDSHVTLPGLVRQNEAPAYLAASDIFLSPHVPNPDGTAFFGSPTKLFEYMAMERPIIASDLDQIGRVLRGLYLDEAAPEAKLAELFTPGDQDGFLAALRKVVENMQEARAMASAAREAALRSYTWDHHVGAILDRMRSLTLL